MFYVLIVEDDPQVLKDAEEMIRTPTCRTVGVTNADEARGALSSIKFDVLIAGLTPASPNFADLILFAREQYATLRIVAGVEQARETPYAEIIDAYLTHPLSPHELKAALRIALMYAGTRLRV